MYELCCIVCSQSKKVLPPGGAIWCHVVLSGATCGTTLHHQVVPLFFFACRPYNRVWTPPDNSRPRAYLQLFILPLLVIATTFSEVKNIYNSIGNTTFRLAQAISRFYKNSLNMTISPYTKISLKFLFLAGQTKKSFSDE